ncbi:hypothetical protein BDV06DRAFT_186882 [Aspergillus oleicola]
MWLVVGLDDKLPCVNYTPLGKTRTACISRCGQKEPQRWMEVSRRNYASTGRQ